MNEHKKNVKTCIVTMKKSSKSDFPSDFPKVENCMDWVSEGRVGGWGSGGKILNFHLIY